MDHVWGSQERWDLYVSKPRMTCDASEETAALESGWLLYDGEWYQSRSVRISSHQPIREFNDGYSISLETDVNRDEISSLWHDYIAKKGFEHNWDLFSDEERSEWLTLRDGCGRLNGFTKMLGYNGGLESQHNAYVDDTGMRIGTLMIGYEAEIALSRGFKHLYIGSGYEKGSIYKSYLNGFEYWTGSEWSNDTIRYRNLCDRDSSVTSIDGLDAVLRVKP